MKRRKERFWTDERLDSDYAVEYAQKLFKAGVSISGISEIMTTNEYVVENLLNTELPEDYVSHIPKADEKYFRILCWLYKLKEKDSDTKAYYCLAVLLIMFILGFISHKQLAKILSRFRKSGGNIGMMFQKEGMDFLIEGKHIFGKKAPELARGVVDYPQLAEILKKNLINNPRGCKAFVNAMGDAGLHKELETLFKDLGMHVVHF